MRSTNKDNTLYPGIRAKLYRANNQTIPGIFLENAPGILPQSFLPHSFIDRHYLVMSQHAAHSVADHHVRLAMGIQLIGRGQFFLYSQYGIEERMAARICKGPEVIMLAAVRDGLDS